MIQRLFLSLLLAAILTSCGEGFYVATATPTPDATPTQEIVPTQPTGDCNRLPGDGFVLITTDPCLDTMPIARGNNQTLPSVWEVINYLETADGFSGDGFYTGYAQIFADEGGYRFAIEGVAGRWGFTQVVDLQPGCYVAKISGYVSIAEMTHSGRSNIGAHVVVGNYDLLFQPFPGGRTDFEMIWPVRITQSGSYTFQALVEARYATALSGTEIILKMIALARDIDGDHCQ